MRAQDPGKKPRVEPLGRSTDVGAARVDENEFREGSRIFPDPFHRDHSAHADADHDPWPRRCVFLQLRESPLEIIRDHGDGARTRAMTFRADAGKVEKGDRRCRDGVPENFRKIPPVTLIADETAEKKKVHGLKVA